MAVPGPLSPRTQGLGSRAQVLAPHLECVGVIGCTSICPHSVAN
jgi:hypothetical protein